MSKFLSSLKYFIEGMKVGSLTECVVTMPVYPLQILTVDQISD